MKIKAISCKQFAGVRDRKVLFADGINVIYGKNESGKSTLVNLLARTLFQKAQLDGRTDKAFVKLYYPGASKNSRIVGDSVDGEITFETEEGIFTLSKEWGKEARCTLSAPDGVIRDQGKIDEILKEILRYGEGVYSDLFFSSRRNMAVSLQTVLDAKNTGVKKEIVDAVSRVFAESDGISIDAIEQAIAARIDVIGKHWDFEQQMPERKKGRGTTGRWKNDQGELLKAYYELEDARNVLEEVSRLEKEADRSAREFADCDTAVRSAEEAYSKFNAFFSSLVVLNAKKERGRSISQELLKIKRILSDWPKFAEELEKAKTLRTEKENRELLDRYEAAKKGNEEWKAADAVTANLTCPGNEEIKQVDMAQRRAATLENKLCGMNLNAAIQMLGDSRMEIVSLRTGEPIEASDGLVSIAEAVKITIPGVMEMQLFPADVDVAAIEDQIARQRNIIAEIFAKYEVESLDALESLAKRISDAKAKADAAKNRLALLLGETTFEKLEAEAGAVRTAVRPKEDIESDIIALCGSRDIDRFIMVKETALDGYKTDYGSINVLKSQEADKEEEQKKVEEFMSAVKDIPAEYLCISDPEAHLQKLGCDLKEKQSLREAALAAKAAAASRMESWLENRTGDPTGDVEKKEQAFEEKKSLLAHWLHIEEVFQEKKKNIHDNPMQDIADSFAHYLAVITDGRVSSEFPEADKLNMNIYSGNRLLDYEKLSEGTRDTVSLAFRLAVLDHLFPEGGVIVFDDPFTDMDADRTAQACKLIQECAGRHQVIFLTCREAYIDMLDGNIIRIPQEI